MYGSVASLLFTTAAAFSAPMTTRMAQKPQHVQSLTARGSESASSSSSFSEQPLAGEAVDAFFFPEDQPKKGLIVGVSPSKNMAADYGFDPLGLARMDPFGSGRDQVDVVNDLRDAELRHGRLAMLCALAWPVQELVSPTIARGLGAPSLLADGRSPSVLNGGLGQGPIPIILLATAGAIAALDLRAIQIKGRSGDDWAPGDFGFDPLRILGGASPYAVKNMQAKEVNNGRLAMLAVLAYVVQEAATGEPIVSLSEQLFTPVIYYPWFQQLLTDSFGMASFR